MKTTISRQLYILYVFIISYKIIIVQCDTWTDVDGLNILNGAPYILLQMEDGSGQTSESSTNIPTISIETTISMATHTVISSSISTSEHTYYSTTDTTLQTSIITSTSSTTMTSISTSTTSSTTSSATSQLEQFTSSSLAQVNTTTSTPLPLELGEVVAILRSSNDSNKIANALISYFLENGNLTAALDKPDTLTPHEVDDLIKKLNDITILDTNNLFIMAQSTFNGSNTTIGATIRNNSYNEVIKNTTKMNIINSDLSVAAIISDQSLNDISSIKMFIINEPKAYKNFNPSDNQVLVSPVIVASVDKRNNTPINITLYFKVIPQYVPNINGDYSCSFLDTDSSTWNQSGCTKAQYNTDYKRYNCICNHLTTFALIWLPNIPQPSYLTSQDIASIVFSSISILCFIAVIIHSLATRLLSPLMSLEARDLLPLISSGSTMIVFIFYIALTMTIFTRTSLPLSTSSCPTNASVLMFITYFFLIFMFCMKTSVGYFNYIRFIHLFPQPSPRKLFLLLIISFFVAITWTSFAAGFNSNSSFNITQLHGNKLCWFTRNSIYYFMTIPVSIFLFINFIILILVARRIIEHTRYATSPHQSYKRMKVCVLVLLSSCATQGIGWLFGPFMTFIDPGAANILGWFFVIFNGLEGLWIVLLYIIIQCQHMDEPQRMTYQRAYMKKTPSNSLKSENERKLNDSDSFLARKFRVTHRKERLVFHDLYNEETIDWETSTCEL